MLSDGYLCTHAEQEIRICSNRYSVLHSTDTCVCAMFKMLQSLSGCVPNLLLKWDTGLLGKGCNCTDCGAWQLLLISNVIVLPLEIQSSEGKAVLGLCLLLLHQMCL